MDPRTIDKLGTEAWTTKVEPAIERALRLLSDDELEAVARLIGYGEDKIDGPGFWTRSLAADLVNDRRTRRGERGQFVFVETRA